MADEQSKVRLLKSLPGADSRLVLFQADIYNPNEVSLAIEGCDCVFHVATPLQHTESSQYKNTTEAAVGGAKSIAMCCVRSITVRRLIYTASAVAASPLKEDGSGFKDFIDETCWTPLNISFAYSNNFLTSYVYSKTLAEKEILRFGNQKDGGELEVVSLACGLVGGDTLLPSTPHSGVISAKVCSGLKMDDTIVCVTGGSDYPGSCLIKRLLEKGYTVHATVRNLGDDRKAGLLKGLPNANTKLKLFEADVYSPDNFDSAIQGCQFVIHMATPLQHEPKQTQLRNTSEAAVGGIKRIVDSCIRSGTVRRLIYTASVVAAQLGNMMGAASNIKSTSPVGLPSIVLSNQAFTCGRFLCASGYLSLAESASHWRIYYPEINIGEEFVEDSGTEIVWGSTKLKDIGFEYKFDSKVILDDSVKCAKRLNEFDAPN
ncbi:hypothetical protein FEM48_Zijuj08G0043100 [Ziziphus jujuba var. spinosa]|uniref:3-beta hydroxysteroid dehydrogenase/isomerase domain-containing protein n=1 Tax=Ziziphus jujuba var. spinosa TaxID=714518 RepID=A0A978UWY4_ZIZJJ|nr:hypothetical protein FEM48_Zijuj08G0043100 [Ziziphus jujuba var. spinosa]